MGASDRRHRGLFGKERRHGQITLPEDNEQILAASYQSCLPTEEQLRQELVTERDRLEQARRLAAAPPPSEEDD